MFATIIVLLSISTSVELVYDFEDDPVTNEANTTTIKNDFKESTQNEYVPVKLNMKQGLVMNQIVTAYALTDSENALCRNHSKEFQNALRAFEPWALKMFDASSKMQPGIFNGNLVEFGSFTQCVQIYVNSTYGSFRGKHCLIKVQPTMEIIKKIVMYKGISEKGFENVEGTFRNASLRWSICVPDSCGHEDVLEHFNKTILSLTEGLVITVSLDKYDCYAKSDEKPLHSSDWILLYFVGALLGIIAISTAVDIWQRNTQTETNKVVSIFSAYSNVEYVVSYQAGDADLSCLNGMRVLSIVWVVFGHRYLMTFYVPSVNSLDLLDWLKEYGSTLIIGATVSVDTFFLMGGLLVCYHFCNYMDKGNKFNLPLFYLNRFIRLTPSCIFTVVFFGTITPHLGSGPFWKKLAMFVQYPCKYYWFTSLLYIQNYVNSAFLCIIPTWYLTCDVLYYAFSPLLMYPLWKWKTLGVINFVLFYAFSLAINFYLAWSNEYRAGQLVDNNMLKSEFFTKHYIVPHVRASTYILGVGFGYVLHKYKNKAIKISYPILLCGWCISILLMATVLLGNYKFQQEDYVYDKLEASSFISMTRSAWVFGVMWIIWVCRAGYGGPVNTLLSSHVFQVLGRLSYSLFLIHMQYQFLISGASKLPMYFSNFNAVQKAFGDLSIVLILSFFLTIFVEYPCVRISLLFFSKGSRKVESEREKVKK